MKNLILITCLLFSIQFSFAQKQKKADSSGSRDSLLLNSMKYRCIGPWRGGRSSAVCGVMGQRNLYYMGSTGGGVWKTADGGNNWKNISDEFFGGSVGTVAVSESDPDVIYVGMGEQTVRGNVSEGFGIWKSVDGGTTWSHAGLSDSRHIVRIRIHPKNPQLVYVAALGHLFGKNAERGIFRSKDGGINWEKILFVNNEVGAADLCMDPNNPLVMFATFWKVKRTPYSLESGGAGSSVYKTIDGGNTWTDITHNEGLPTDTLGVMMVSISPVNNKRIFMMVESATGGLFRSDDGGKTFTRVNEERNIRQRAWYFSRVYADTRDENTVYVLNVEFHKSIDGGRTFKTISTPHGDHHDLWIDPEDNKRVIIADDGGAQITFDGGANWSSYHNQPTAQFYRIAVDNHFPYRVYGAQQDNSSIRIHHRTRGGSIDQHDWENTAGGECGYHAIDPLNDDIVYGCNYGGYLERFDHKTGERRDVSVWPDSPIGWGADSLKFRFQWNFPIFFSPHNPKKLYAAGNVLFQTTDEGLSWTAISPDLTRNDKSRMLPSGGIITKDNTGVEYYGTIFTACESPIEPGVIWCGSDDGLLHVSQNGGKDWSNVTPPGIPKWIMFNCLDADPFNKGGLYVAATNYKNDDFAPYIFHTTDYGRSWSKITSGINAMHFTRCIRADKKRKGLLYAGTEYGMYISFNNGANWKSFQQNLPEVPITDLVIKDDDLVIATQGRSFWVLDDLTLLHQYSDSVYDQKLFLFRPRTTWAFQSGKNENLRNAGENPLPGVVVNYYLKEKPHKSDSITLRFLDSNLASIKSFKQFPLSGDEKLSLKQGMNQINWNMLYPEADKFEGMLTWNGNGGNPAAPPGKYFVSMSLGKDSVIKEFTIKKPGNVQASDEDLQAKFMFLIRCRDKLSETNSTVKQIREIRNQLNEFTERINSDKTINESIRNELSKQKDSILKKLTPIEERLYQTKAKAGQDFLNYPVMLNDKLADLMNAVNIGNTRPSKQAQDLYIDLSARIDEQINAFEKIQQVDLQNFNEFIISNKLPVIGIKQKTM